MKFAYILTAILAISNLYVAFSLRSRLVLSGPPAAALFSFFLIFFGVQLVAPLLEWPHLLAPYGVEGPAWRFLVQSSYLAMGILSCLIVYMIVADVVSLVIKPFISPYYWGRLDQMVIGFLALAMVVTVTIGLSNAGETDVEKIDVTLPKLPAALDGVTIAQITDLHVGAFLGQPFIKQVSDKVAALKPDIIVLTGDIADGTIEELGETFDPFASLNPPLGKYVIPGNHEYFWGAPTWMGAMRARGFHPLLNGYQLIRRDGAQLVLAGVTDLSTKHAGAPRAPDPRLAIDGAPQDAVKILLAHQPKQAFEAEELGYDLQLSGHTHAGQYFPFTVIVRFFQPFIHGLYKLGGMQLYVNKGTGFWGPPLRTGGPGEITLLTLRKGA